MNGLKHASRNLFTASCAALVAGAATAQHTDFVLFGEPDAAMNAVAPEHRFVHPITSPYVHENSFITTDLRAWYVYHYFDNATLGGDATVVAAQARLAITDRWQLVAYKDGYVWFDDPTVNDDGWNDLAAGVKYNFYRDIENQLYASAGIGYEWGIGDDEVLQDDDELRLWFSADKGFDELHLGFAFNYFLPAGTEDSPFGSAERISWHAHADYYLTEWMSPVLELNGYHTIDASSTAAVGFTGVDVANLGGGESQDVVTMGLGAELRLLENTAIRGAYEFPLTDETDLFGDRLTVSLVYSF